MHTLFSSFNIEENWSTLKNILSNLADKFIPKIKTTQSLTNVPCWSVGLSKAVEKNTIFIVSTYIVCLLMTFIFMPNKGF